MRLVVTLFSKFETVSDQSGQSLDETTTCPYVEN